MKVYQISANLVHRELRNATFEGRKIATSIKRPDSAYMPAALPKKVSVAHKCLRPALTIRSATTALQRSPLNGSRKNGSTRLLVQFLVGLILHSLLRKIALVIFQPSYWFNSCMLDKTATPLQIGTLTSPNLFFRSSSSNPLSPRSSSLLSSLTSSSSSLSDRPSLWSVVARHHGHHRCMEDQRPTGRGRRRRRRNGRGGIIIVRPTEKGD